MNDTDNNRILFGTMEAPQTLHSVQIGPLSLLYSCDSIRRICWQGTELVRGITWPIRDENWGTYSSVIHDEQIKHDSETFEVQLHFSVADGRLDCLLNLAATAQGEVSVNVTMTPLDGQFLTNRAGITVLHPINDTAGIPVAVTQPDGKVQTTCFPRLISFDQPVQNIQGLSYSVGEAHVDISFEGEVFEMEDQRNWSDASYKTYCVPLVHPFTYAIDKPVTQSVSLTCSGLKSTSQSAVVSVLNTKLMNSTAPQIALAAQQDWIGDKALWKLIAKLHLTQVVLRIGCKPDIDFLFAFTEFLNLLNAKLDIEIVLDNDEPVADAMQRLATDLINQGLQPTRVLALREIYMASHQPSGPWPDGATPVDVCVAAKSAFPSAKIGGGMLTNFTELNRCRPEPAQCDYISHANTSIVHASDDLSVLETLETLPRIFESAVALSGGKPYRLGLVSIGMRTNPYGSAVTENPKQIRCTMAREDPRQRGLFAAAWAVGVLAATQDSVVESICLAAPSGPFGITYTPQYYPQIGYDDSNNAVFPLYHVVRVACQMMGAQRLSFSGLPDGVVAYGVQYNNENLNHAMLANATDKTQIVPISRTITVVVLDADSFDNAVLDPDWLEKSEPQEMMQLNLKPFAVAFARWAN